MLSNTFKFDKVKKLNILNLLKFNDSLIRNELQNFKWIDYLKECIALSQMTNFDWNKRKPFYFGIY